MPTFVKFKIKSLKKKPANSCQKVTKNSFWLKVWLSSKTFPGLCQFATGRRASFAGRVSNMKL